MKFFKTTLYLILGLLLFTALIFGHKDIPVEELKEKYATSPSKFLTMDGMEVHFRDEGNPLDSLPIVLIHGTGASLHTFDSWVDDLKKDRRVIRMDIPAYGLTGPFPERDYAMANYVTFVKHFLEEVEVEKCVLAGNSLGGQIAWEFTLTHSGVVDKLVLIDALGYPLESKSVPIAFKMASVPYLNKTMEFITPRFIVKSSVENVFYDKSKVSEALVDRFMNLTLRAGNRQAFNDRIMQLKGVDNSIERVSEISQPTLILWGAEDLLIPVSSAHRFHEDLPNSTLAILEKTGHTPMEENPKESLSALMGFLEK